MTDDTTQTAAQTTEATAQPAAEATGAQTDTAADLESILSSFDKETERPASAPVQKPADQTSPDVLSRVAYLEKALAEKDFNEAITPVVERIKSGLPVPLSNKRIQALLDQAAKDSPTMQKFWLERNKNPANWAHAEKQFVQELAKELSRAPDANATEDREAVTAAVRGASQKAPAETAPNYGAMTDAEFQKEKARLGF